MPPKYSLPECERRWLVGAPPDGLDPGRLIEDLYLDGTRLRLRRETDADGHVLVWKLARKYGATARGIEPMTNLYLTQAEHALLAALPAAAIRKRRYPAPFAGLPFVIDRFEDELAGHAIAELELPNADALWAAASPPWCGREITGDPAYAGAKLAREGWPTP